MRALSVGHGEVDLGEVTTLDGKSPEDFNSLLLDESDVPERGEVGRIECEGLFRAEGQPQLAKNQIPAKLTA